MAWDIAQGLVSLVAVQLLLKVPQFASIVIFWAVYCLCMHDSIPVQGTIGIDLVAGKPQCNVMQCNMQCDVGSIMSSIVELIS